MSPLPSPSGHSPRTLSIGGATYDLFVRTDQSIIHQCEGRDVFSLPLGDKIRINDVVSTFGGGAANTSVGLARLGCNAAFCGVIGDDQWGNAFLDNFKKEGVNADLATIVEKETSSFSLVLSAQNGERVILNHPGTATHLDDVTFDRDKIPQFDAVFLNHIHEESCEIENDLIEILLSNPTVHLSWNPGGCQIEKGLAEKNNALLVARTHVLFLNKEEALMFAHTQTVKEALYILRNAGAQTICITDSKKGSYATDGKHLYHCDTDLSTVVVDTTGAGDAFGTGVTWGLLSGKDLPTSLRAGTINAMSVVGVTGAEPGLLSETQIQEHLERTPLTITVETF